MTTSISVSDKSKLGLIANENIIGTIKISTVKVTYFLSLFVKKAYKSKLSIKTQTVPPRTPVYSYHCTMLGKVANTFPNVNQGQA